MTKDYMGVDFDKLKSRLREVEENSKKEKSVDPTRGLSGDLMKKVVVGLAGHRSGVLTDEEIKEMESLQVEYDQKILS